MKPLHLALALVALAGAAAPATAATKYYAYDGVGRLSAVGQTDGSSQRYSYDAADNRRSLQAVPFVGNVDANGFDAEYYLLMNPDIANAGLDPWTHYQQFGWKEGRNPNAYFSSQGYMNAYPDTVSAGFRPLDHYNQYGWKEKRDPSGSFNTKLYLQNYSDIANLGINPLVHFLRYGLDEGRSPYGTGSYDPPQ